MKLLGIFCFCVALAASCEYLGEDCEACVKEKGCLFGLFDGEPIGNCVKKTQLGQRKIDLNFPSIRACHRYKKITRKLRTDRKSIVRDQQVFAVPSTPVPSETSSTTTWRPDEQTESFLIPDLPSSTHPASESDIPTSTKIPSTVPTYSSGATAIYSTEIPLYQIEPLPTLSTAHQQSELDIAQSTTIIPSFEQTSSGGVSEIHSVDQATESPLPISVMRVTEEPKMTSDIPKKSSRGKGRKGKNMRKRRESPRQRMYRELCDFTEKMYSYSVKFSDETLMNFAKKSPTFLNYPLCDFLQTRLAEF